MRCEDIKEELISFVLGELNEEENDAISRHLESCVKCRSEVEQYRQTLSALSRWNVPAHGRPPNFAFLPAPPATGYEPDPSKRRLRKFARAGVAAVFVLVFAAALTLGTNIRYDGGAISITVGTTKVGYAPIDSAKIAAIVDSVRQHDMQLVSDMIAASEARQADRYRTDLTAFSRQLNDQERGYLVYLMNHIYRLQQQDQIAYYQSRAALDGVVKLASAVR